jgi:hypothetical protein
MVLPVPSPELLKPFLDRAREKYPKLKQAAEQRVSRWVWATGSTRSLLPGYDDKIHGTPSGRELGAEPVRREGHFQYGLDSEGRLAVTRFHSGPEVRFTESFFVWEGSRVLEWSFGPDPQYKDPAAVSQYDFEGGVVVAYCTLNADGRTQAEAYECEGGRLVTLRRVGTHPDFAKTYHHTYDGSGDLVSITVLHDAGAHGVVYTRPTRTLPALLKSVGRTLLTTIPQRVASLAPSEPAFCLALIYEPTSVRSILPPKLALGLESDRTAWRASGAPVDELWDAQRFATFDDDRLEFDDPDLLSACGELAELLRTAHGVDRAHKVLVDLARHLNKVDFGALVRITPEFVVYPVDLHLEHLAADMAAAAPAAKRRKLKGRGEL